MDRGKAERYARQWIADWNADLGAELAHFEDDVVFSSPRALAVVGVPTVHGKAALLAYWTRALGSLRFSLDRIARDPETSELSIFYDCEDDGHGVVPRQR